MTILKSLFLSFLLIMSIVLSNQCNPDSFDFFTSFAESIEVAVKVTVLSYIPVVAYMLAKRSQDFRSSMIKAIKPAAIAGSVLPIAYASTQLLLMMKNRKEPLLYTKDALGTVAGAASPISVFVIIKTSKS